MDNKHYTIIIPHYNIPQLLERCLNSIPRRSDTQVIVVDDNSNDKVIPQLKELEKLFSHVEFVYSNINGWGGKARNIGLSRAKGKYILFSDADDFFSPLLNQILDDYKTRNFDLVFFKVKKIYSDTLKPTMTPHHLNAYIDLWNIDPEKSENYLRYLFGEPWCKIVRKEIIDDNNIKFDETRIHNDTTFSYSVGYFAKTVFVDDRELYYYTVREGSTSRQKDLERIYTRIDVFGRCELFFRSKGIPFHEDRYLSGLYMFLKSFSIAGFRKGMNQLINMGFPKHEIEVDYAKAVAKLGILAPAWSIVFVPIIRMKIMCLYYWLIISWPNFIRYKVLRLNNMELRRY